MKQEDRKQLLGLSVLVLLFLFVLGTDIIYGGGLTPFVIILGGLLVQVLVFTVYDFKKKDKNKLTKRDIIMSYILIGISIPIIVYILSTPIEWPLKIILALGYILIVDGVLIIRLKNQLNALRNNTNN